MEKQRLFVRLESAAEREEKGSIVFAANQAGMEQQGSWQAMM
jgi:hypothetical protein